MGMRLPISWLILFALAGCGGGLRRGKRATRGRLGLKVLPAPPAPLGASGTIIRSVEGNCSGPCTVACENNERILSVYAA